MSFEEFENKARLYVLGVLEDEEFDEFRKARAEFGERAEEVVCECRKLAAAFALSLRPRAAAPTTKDKLLDLVRQKRPAAHSVERSSQPA